MTNWNANAITITGEATVPPVNAYRILSSAGVNAAVIKSSTAQLFAYSLLNKNAAPRYVKLYNKATAPTAADVPVLTLMVPGSSTGAGQNVCELVEGMHGFGSGMSIRITGGPEDNDNTSISQYDVIGWIGWK